MGSEVTMENPMLELEGQAHIMHFIHVSVQSMVMKCAVDLRIADIIHSHGDGCPISLSQIAAGINSSPSPDLPSLARLMKLLTHMKLFTATGDGAGETLYGLTHSSKWLLHGAHLSLAPLLSLSYNPVMFGPLSYLSDWVKEGGTAFGKANGCEVWELASQSPEFNEIFNRGMESTARIATEAVIAEYRDGFGCIGSLVDVGGGTGAAMAKIVKAYPHIKGTNFDLPHVVATAPVYPGGIVHVGGDMFDSVPPADAILMKSIMHDWNDEDCIRILKNCRKAIPEKTGKVVIVDVVLQPDGDGLFHNVGMIYDFLMMAFFSGGKERTELEWKKLLKEGGFPRYKIIKIPALQSIIEAYPE